MRRAVGYLAGAGLLLLAFGVAYSTPHDDVIEGPIAVRPAIGQPAAFGDLAMTVHEVSLAREIEVDFTRLTTAGIWLVAEITVEGTTERTSVNVDVLIDGRRYPASGRADGTADEGVVDAAFPITGPVIVELPANVQDLPGARTAVLRFSPSGDARLDAVIEIVIDLTALEVVDDLEVEGARDGIR
jgi:hypothetical protein